VTLVLYRLLLRCFPTAFRHRFGDDMAAVFADRHRAAAARGRLAIVALWWRTMTDVVTHGLSERRAGRRRGGHIGVSRSDHMLSSIVHDIRFALRGFRQRPGFTAVALLTLALGIGANTAIFSVVHAVLIRELPFPQSDELVRVYATHRKYNFDHGVMNPFDYTYIEQRASSLAGLSTVRGCSTTLTGAGDPVQLACNATSASFFDVLATRPALGRAFTADEADANARVVVISHRLWQTRFGGRADIVDLAVTLDGREWTVVGVMPDGRALPANADLWRPFTLTPAMRAEMGSWFLGTLARLRPGVALETAKAEIEAIGRELEAAYPARRTDRGFNVVGLHDDLASRSADGLRLLQGVAAFVLLIACVNVANLLIAQATARRREFGVRAALGGSRWRLVRQSLTESVVLSLGGALLGTTIAVWGVGALVAMAPPFLLPDPESIGVSWPVLGATTIAAAMTGVLFGLVPALLSASPALAQVVGTGQRAAAAGLSWTRGQWLRSGLVAAEVALAIVLVAGAGLLVRSFSLLIGQPPGFTPGGLLTAQFTLPSARYPTAEARSRFWVDLVDRMSALPGVERAGGTDALPFSTWEWQMDFTIEGREEVPNDGAGVRTVTPGFFATLEMPPVAGRVFDDSDTAGSGPVVVVSDAFAAEHLPGMSPVGQRLGFGPPKGRVWSTIVGVVPATRHLGLDEALRPEIYWPLAQRPGTSSFHVALRTSVDPLALVSPLRAAVRDLDPNLPVQELKTMDALIAARVAPRRFYMTLLVLFAVLAAALAATGIFGVMAYIVSQGRREIGIRLALGARPAQVRSRIVAQGLVVVALGAAAGLVGAFLLSPLLSAELFRVTPTDPATYGAAACALLSIALLACWIPARRTTHVDPATVLRE
jgi:putative ABC transport system permease protein